MEPVSRRFFFKQAGSAAAIAAVAGSAVAGPLGLGGALAGAATKSSPPVTPLSPEEDLRGNEMLVAHVKNSRTGEIALFIGNREVTIRDRSVAARLVRATR